MYFCREPHLIRFPQKAFDLGFMYVPKLHTIPCLEKSLRMNAVDIAWAMAIFLYTHLHNVGATGESLFHDIETSCKHYVSLDGG